MRWIGGFMKFMVFEISKVYYVVLVIFYRLLIKSIFGKLYGGVSCVFRRDYLINDLLM